MRKTVIRILIILFLIAALYAPFKYDLFFTQAYASGNEELRLDDEGSRLALKFEESALLAFGGIFLLGLALNLTPCIYPMFAVTVSIFASGRKKSRLSSFISALVYVLGIASMYSALGVAAAFTGGLFGALLQSRVVLFLIALLFFALSLTMFGFYEIKIPAFFMKRLGGFKPAGLAGIFSAGLFVGIFAAPCAGPPVIGLLTLVGVRADPLFGFAAFFVFSIGLGFPYLILGTYSGLLSKLPKSGSWMVWVRKIFGLLLFAFFLFYLSLTFSRALIFTVIPLALFIGGLYLGFIEKSGNERCIFRLFKKLIGAVIIFFAAASFFYGRAPSAEWLDYSTELEAQARAKNDFVLIYFSAEWCIPCLEMDIRTFSKDEVQKAFDGFYLLKFDLTDYDSAESKKIRERFNISGVPTIVFLDGQGREIRKERLVGFVPEERLLKVLKRVKKNISSGVIADYILKEDEEAAPSSAFFAAEDAWIQPGRPFKAGVLFRIRKDWHIYWINPGDSGMAPKIKWILPDGFSIGEIKWPAPMRFEDSGFATFGNEDPLLLFADIIPPDDLKAGEDIELKADIYWLVCKDICVAQETEVSLVIPARNQTPIKSAYAEFFNYAEKNIPVFDSDWKFSAAEEEGYAVLYVYPPSNIAPEKILNSLFFPSKAGQLRTDSVQWQQTEDGYYIKMRLEGITPLGNELEGVLVFGGEASPRAVNVKSPLK